MAKKQVEKRTTRPPTNSKEGKGKPLDNRYARAELAADLLGDDTEDQKAMLASLTDKQRIVMQLKMRGATQEQIAVVLGTSQSAVSHMLQRVREHLEIKGKSVDQSLVIGENLTFYDEIEKEAWDIKDDAEGLDKLKAIQVLMSARKDRNKLLMDVGLLRVAPKEVEHTLKTTPLIEAMRQDRRTDEVVITAISTTHEELEEPEPPMLGPGEEGTDED